jgi:hypothetical protein
LEKLLDEVLRRWPDSLVGIIPAQDFKDLCRRFQIQVPDEEQDVVFIRRIASSKTPVS